MTGLAGRNCILLIKRQGTLPRPRRLLPLVVHIEGAQPLVFIQQLGNRCLVTHRAKFRRAVEIFHHRARVQLGLGEDVVVRNRPGHRRAIFIQHHRRHAHHVASGAAGVLYLLDGMADHAGHAVFIEAAIHRGIFAQRAGEQRRRIVATFAMPRVLDALAHDDQVHILDVKRIAKRIGVRRFAPLAVRIFVALAAIGGGRDLLRLEKSFEIRFGLAGQKRIFPKAMVVAGIFLGRGRCRRPGPQQNPA